MVESERVILGELELLAPATEVPVPDWQQVRRRVEPSSSLNRRRVRLAIGVAAVALVAIAGASAAYLTSRAGSPTPVTNGELVIDSAPGGVAQLSSVRADGRLRVLMEVPATVPLRQSQWHVVVSGRQATRGRTCDGWRQLTVCRPRRPHTTHGKVQAPVGGREMPGQRIRASRRRRLVAGRPVDRVHLWLVEDPSDPAGYGGRARDLDGARQCAVAVVVARWAPCRVLRRPG